VEFQIKIKAYITNTIFILVNLLLYYISMQTLQRLSKLSLIKTNFKGFTSNFSQQAKSLSFSTSIARTANKRSPLFYNSKMSFAGKNVDDLIDNMLKTKGQRPEYSQQYGSPQQDGKRNKINFIRDGMVLSFQIKRGQTRKETYIWIELREFSEQLQGYQETKDQRFLSLTSMNMCKFLLLKPSTKAEKLESIEFNYRFRDLKITQTKENKYLFKLSVSTRPEGSQINDVSNPEVVPERNLFSQIELLPEDIVLLKIYAEYAVKDLNNLV
jgi:hypothetical protein